MLLLEGLEDVAGDSNALLGRQAQLFALGRSRHRHERPHVKTSNKRSIVLQGTRLVASIASLHVPFIALTSFPRLPPAGRAGGQADGKDEKNGRNKWILHRV